MPRLPSAEDLGQRPTPRLQGGVSRLPLSTPRRGAEAQAEIQFGEAVKGLGDTLFVLGVKEKARTDEARAEEAFSTYQDTTLDLEYGEQNGFTRIRGGDAIKQPLVENYRVKREGIAKQIREGLDNPIQQAAFDKRAGIVDRQFDARLYRHVSEQSNVYQEQTFEGVMATERRAAALNWDQPGQIEMSLLRTDMEIERMARLKGFPPESVEQMKVIAGTQIHADVVNQMLIGGKDKAAAAYFNQIKSELTPEAMVILGGKVDAASVDGEALRGADVVWDALGPKNPNDPVRLDMMEAWIRDRYKDDPRQMKAAIQDIRSRAVANNDAQQEMTAASQAEVLDAYHEGADLRTIQSMPAYQALDGKSRTELRDYIVGRGWSEQQHARSEAQYREGEKAAESWGLKWELSNPEVLSTISEAQISKLEPRLGRANTEELLKEKRKLNSPENIKAATMDAKQFNQIAFDAGLDPYTKNQSTEQKEYLGRLHDEVMSAIDIAQRGGKTLGYTEKGTLMRKMVDQKVYTDGWGTSTPSMPAPVVRPEQRSQIFVPIEKVDSAWMKGAINYMRSQGLAPIEWDDATVKRNMKGRLERAYAISITGGSSDEGKKALEGTDEGIRQ